MTPPLVTALNLKIKGVPGPVRLASQMILGAELYHLQQKLGYQGGGAWWSARDEVAAGTRPTWVEFCKAEAGVTETSARHYYECGEAFKNRLRWVRFKPAKPLLKMMEKVPSTLTAEDREGLIDRISRMIPDATAVCLRNEFRAAKLTPEELKEVQDDPSTAARVDERRFGRARAVLVEEARRIDPEAIARMETAAEERQRKMMQLARLALIAFKDQLTQKQS